VAGLDAFARRPGERPRGAPVDRPRRRRRPGQPETVTLTFSEAVQPVADATRLVDASGTERTVPATSDDESETIIGPIAGVALLAALIIAGGILLARQLARRSGDRRSSKGGRRGGESCRAARIRRAA
jgi:hypothetical protein